MPDPIQSLETFHTLPEQELTRLLLLKGDEALPLRKAADRLRKSIMGDKVYLRGIIEFSNFCKNSCLYCGIRGPNTHVSRYRIEEEEILKTARQIRNWGCGTVVLQSGEDPAFTTGRLADIVASIKTKTDLAITLSVGIRTLEELRTLRAAGADRYLLRFETSNRELFEKIHPDGGFSARIRCLRDLREAGFQVGSGFMIGLPGTGPDQIARDLLFTRDLKLDMIGCGPFLANPQTPLNEQPDICHDIYYNTIALLRLMNPLAHIPATTAFDALEKEGRNRVLLCGANVFMPNTTPWTYRSRYQLYPNKPNVDEDGSETLTASKERLQALGRSIGTGRGDSIRNGFSPTP